MCAIVGGLGEPSDAALKAVAHRGPDHSAIVQRRTMWFGHARLSILDVTSASNQPFKRGDLTLAYNGELWNYVQLRDELCALGHTFKTTGDTEVFAAALQQWGDAALPRLQGMFAVAWTRGNGVLKLARDRHGEVPLHAFVGKPFTFASELKAFKAMGLDARGYEWVNPGETWEVTKDGIVRRRWYEVPDSSFVGSRELAEKLVFEGVRQGSIERTIADVPVCTLLSGGVDSAAVAAHVVGLLPNLVAYVAVMNPRSPDVRAAREVAEHLGIELREVTITPPTSDDLAGVVRQIELPHKAQVEIGWACSLLARQMQADGFKVTFSGEGSDELWASYGFAYHGIQQKGWAPFRRDLFHDQHRKNFARCNKVFMARGIECRLPFLSTGLVETALSLPQDIVQKGRSRPKAVLQDGHASLLPKKIVERQKLAFQDGLGLKSACETAVADPRAFYAGVWSQMLGS
jgi:asparagine synthase (glutamine-hydrolysing)